MLKKGLIALSLLLTTFAIFAGPKYGFKWEYRDVVVKTPIYEDYVEKTRQCTYSGHIYLGHLQYQPDFHLLHYRNTQQSTVVAETVACPVQQYASHSETYWYTETTQNLEWGNSCRCMKWKDSTRRGMAWADYRGYIPLVSQKVLSENKRRIIGYTEHTERKLVRIPCNTPDRGCDGGPGGPGEPGQP